MKVLFRKADYRIIALFPEVPGNVYDASLCHSFVYIDTNAFFSETGIRYPCAPLDQREANITETVSNTTRAEPAEYKQLKNILESDYGFVLEVVDEVNDEMHLKRHNEFIGTIKAKEQHKKPTEIISNNDIHKFHKDTPKEDFWNIVFKGFVFVVLGLIFLFFVLVFHPLGWFFILWGIFVGVIGLFYFVGKYFSSIK
jgi:hypothetical protein